MSHDQYSTDLSRPLYNTAFYRVNHSEKRLVGPYSRYDDALTARHPVHEQVISKAFARLLMESGYSLDAPGDEDASMVAA